MVAAPGDRVAYDAVPYFWSDQFDVKIQAVGLMARADATEILEGAPDDGRFVAVGVRAGRAVAAVAFNAPRRLAFYRRRLAAMPPLEELAADVASDDRALVAA
jgi:hypothetical protein